MTKQNKWPKVIAPLNPEQSRISDDFMAHWHTVLPSRYGLIDEFNHNYPVKHAPRSFLTTLEIGAGLGEHLNYERLTADQRKNYYCVDLRANMVDAIRHNFPEVQAIVHDCQEPMDGFKDGYFDRVVAVHVLEHLPNLPAAIRDVYRLLNKETGVLSVVIPCEGGLAYGLARRISAQRIFEKRYNQSYKWFIEREHINLANEVLAELHPYFEVTHRLFFPLSVLPVQTLNLVIGVTMKPRDVPLH